MQFRIADTFIDSLSRLTGEEQKAVKMTAFDLQMNPANPGMQLHRLDRAKDKNFWSARVSTDLRLIVHRTGYSMLLCYVDHHNDAYQWASRRKLETHPKTGAAQLVEIRETVKEITIPKYVEVAQPKPPESRPFAHLSDDDLLGYGVPADWLQDVRHADEDSIFDIAEHLPPEAAEALLDLATGVTPPATQLAPAGTGPFDHPDARRRFQVVNSVEDLKRALEDLPETASIDDPLVAISVARQYPNVKNDDDLYNITRGTWKVNRGGRASRAEYAFAVYKGLIKEVYNIDSWRPATREIYVFFAKLEGKPESSVPQVINDGRSEFVGKVAPEPVRQKYVGRRLPRRFFGFPVLYFNCGN
jgi:mRNA-degrading endonuclease RelE of RelBE toxin-antitoxin system